MKPCLIVQDCPCSGNPLSNFSSEAPDQDVFLGFNTGWNTNDPNPGDSWTNPDGYGFCTSTVSQEDADQCSANCQLNNQLFNGTSNCPDGTNGDGPGTNPDGGNRGGAQTFANSQQECAYDCGDGNQYVWTVDAGYVTAQSQAQADSIAASLACKFANSHHICPGALDHKGTCADAFYSGTIKALVGPSVKGPLTWTLDSGTLPPGLSLDPDTSGDPTASLTLAIDGNVSSSASGDYNFVLKATDVNGNFNRKAYKISVLVITCPPDATPGVPYSYQMTAAGGVGPFKWQIDLGSLPPGLTMTDAGLITGTTTTVQAKYPITFSVADSGLVVACSKACTFYNQCPGANLLDTVFSAIKNSAGTCGCPACSANNNSMTFGVGVCPPPPGNLESCDYSYQSSAFTSATNFTLRITITITGTVTAFAQHTMPLYKSGVLQSDLEASLSYSPGTHTFDFPLTAGSYTIGKGGVNNARYSILFSGTGGSVTWSFNNKC